MDIEKFLNLLGKGYDILRTSAFLSLEYKMLVKPNKILKLVDHLEREQLIKKSNS